MVTTSGVVWRELVHVLVVSAARTKMMESQCCEKLQCKASRPAVDPK